MAKQTGTFVRYLTGHSGCGLSLFRDARGMFVRKSSSGPDYNKRLEIQCLKQKSVNATGFTAPRVLSYGLNDDGLFYFDMEFINCLSLDKQIKTMKMGDIPVMISTLFDLLPIHNCVQTGAAVTAVADKLAELTQKITKPTENVSAAMDVLAKYDFSHIPESTCHGDLTLENIMISEGGKIYLIDLLDSFLNSWVVDIAKVLQDVDLGWSYRHGKKDTNLELRLLVAKEEIFKNILTLENGPRVLSDVYHILLLNVLRVFPYAKDETTFAFLDGALTKVLQQIKEP